MNNTSFRILLEKVKAEIDVHHIKLPVYKSLLSPVFSIEAITLHYDVLYKNYVKKSLDGEGEFQTAGAILHTKFFEQFRDPKSNNKPTGSIKDIIDSKFGDFESFKNDIRDVALEIQGSGWVYLNKTGVIKKIHNHKIVDDIAVIIDMWEHSWIIDYGADKEKYLKNIWQIINWDIVNVRLN